VTLILSHPVRQIALDSATNAFSTVMVILLRLAQSVLSGVSALLGHEP
jgi:hypothetical protein